MRSTGIILPEPRIRNAFYHDDTTGCAMLGVFIIPPGSEHGFWLTDESIKEIVTLSQISHNRNAEFLAGIAEDKSGH